MNYLALKRISTILFTRQSQQAARNILTFRSARAFSTESLSLSNVINNFNARGEADEITVTGISKTMGDILKTHISFGEHQQYHPISDELAYYVVKLLSQHKKPFVSYQQARTFLDFGTTFDVQDREYWNAVIASLQEAFQDMKAKDLLTIVSQLKQFGLLTSQFTSQALTQVKDQIQVLTTPEIVLFTMIYTSSIAKSSMPKDSNFEEKLDFILSKHTEQMTSQEFAQICNSIACTDSSYSNVQSDEEPLFQSFLKEAVQQVEQWLVDNSFPIEDLPSVILAYSSIMDQLESDKTSSLQAKMEQVIFENSRNINVSEAVNLIQASCHFSSATTTELLDRIIGNGIYEVRADQVLGTLKAFMSTGNARSKIFQVLMKRIRDHINEFSLSELTELSLLLRSFGNNYEGIYDLIEPYILNKIHTLSETDLVFALQGFYNPTLSKRFQILDLLESTVVSQIDTLSQATVEGLLAFYNEHQMGSRILIESLKSRVENA